jgi:2-dehydropantoate 2-reductase
MSTQEQWHIAGPGAIGLLFYYHLSSSQEIKSNPVLINRSHTSDFKEYGLTLPSQKKQCTPVHWFTGNNLIKKLIITTKSYQVIPCIEALSQYLAPSCQIILLHNGLGVQQQAQQRWPEYSFYFATTTEGAWKKSPTELVYAGIGATHIGQQNTAPPKWFTNELHTLGIHWNSQILSQLHSKVAINAAINPLTVIYECKNGQLLENVEAIEIMAALCNETQTVLEQLGFIPSNLFDKVCLVAQNTSNNYSSSYQDWKHQRKTELNNMNGYIQEQARFAGISTPTHDAILREVATKAIL